MNKKVIYLDSHASTPVDQDVLSVMLPYFTEHYGNGNHKAGWKTNSAVENARFQVSNLIGAKPSEITFTSGATEAINIALFGLLKSNASKRNHIITQKTEHPAILQSVNEIRRLGYKVTILNVDTVGRINTEDLKQAATEQTLVVAIMLANNEIGTVQPIKQIGEISKSVGAKFFCDITQGLGWYQLNMNTNYIDMASISAHKIYGPRGVGALFVRKKANIKLKPILFGGGQEKGIRPSTINTPAIVGFGKTCDILNSESNRIFGHIKMLRDRMENQLFSSIEGIKLNGCPENRHPGNLNISIPTISGEVLKGKLPNVMFSTTSACSSTSTKPSRVIKAIQANDLVLKNSFRIGIGKYNTIEEIDYVANKIIDLVKEK